MLETKNLILDKANFSDWEDMYKNVWSQPESARYMYWNLTTNEEDAQIRIMKTIEFQKTHDTYFVYEKASGKAIGFAGVAQLSPTVYEEAGICLGPDYVGKGYGKQILRCLLDYCKDVHGAEEFIYSAREENIVSNHLAKSFCFELIDTENCTDHRDGHEYKLLKYSLKL